MNDGGNTHLNSGSHRLKANRRSLSFAPILDPAFSSLLLRQGTPFAFLRGMVGQLVPVDGIMADDSHAHSLHNLQSAKQESCIKWPDGGNNWHINDSQH
jgi:hypothetical protein